MVDILKYMRQINSQYTEYSKEHLITASPKHMKQTDSLLDFLLNSL